MKRSGDVDNGTRKRSLDFDDVLDSGGLQKLSKDDKPGNFVHIQSCSPGLIFGFYTSSIMAENECG